MNVTSVATLFEKYELNKCPLKFVTKLVRNPGHSDCVERFSGCLLKVSNWRPCVHRGRVVTTPSGRKMAPKVRLSEYPRCWWLAGRYEHVNRG